MEEEKQKNQRYEQLISLYNLYNYGYDRYTIMEADKKKGFRIIEFDRKKGEIIREDRF